MFISDREFWPILKELIPDLQDEIISIDIHCAVSEPVTMNIKSYVKDKDYNHIIVDDDLVTETKKYNLVEIMEDDE